MMKNESQIVQFEVNLKWCWPAGKQCWRSLGHWASALTDVTACCPTVISVDVHSISGALTFTTGANGTHSLCFSLRGNSSTVSHRDWEIKGRFETVQGKIAVDITFVLYSKTSTSAMGGGDYFCCFYGFVLTET